MVPGLAWPGLVWSAAGDLLPTVGVPDSTAQLSLYHSTVQVHVQCWCAVPWPSVLAAGWLAGRGTPQKDTRRAGATSSVATRVVKSYIGWAQPAWNPTSKDFEGGSNSDEPRRCYWGATVPRFSRVTRVVLFNVTSVLVTLYLTLYPLVP
ncbi:hypothetical protein V8C34DRAFT_189559 [Trichoderma compactum]